MTFYQVRKQTPQALDLGEIERAMIAKQNRHDKAIEAENQLKATISALEFNEAEGEFRDQLYNQINTVVEQNSENGYMGNAYDDIMKLTGNIVSNPGINARLKAQQAYKAYQKSIDDSDLPDQYKQYYKAKNSYHYNDVYDKNGRIIGGSTWTPTNLPVEQMDYFKVFNEAIKNIKADTYSNKILRYKDSNGNLKTTWGEGDELVWYDVVTNTTQTVDKEAVRKAVNAYVDTHPEVMASLQQDRDVAFWASNTDGQESYFKSKDNTGVKLSLEDFKNEVFNKYIESHDYSASVRNVDINKDYVTDIAALKKAELAERNAKIKEGQANLDDLMGYKFRSASASKTVIRDNNNIQDASIKSQLDANLKALYKEIYKTDYSGDILDSTNFIQIINDEDNPLVKQRLIEEYDNAILLYGESIMNNSRIKSDESNNGYRAAIEFEQARLDGSGFKQDGGEEYNQLVSKWNNIINKFFPEDTKEVKFNLGAENVAKRFKKLVGNNYSKYGIKFDGNSIIIDKNHAKYLPEIAAILNQSFDVERMWQFDKSNVELINENNNNITLTEETGSQYLGPTSIGIDSNRIQNSTIKSAINDILNLSKSLDKYTAPVDEVLLEERLYTGGTPQAAIAQAYLNGHQIGDKFKGQTQDQISGYIKDENDRVLELILGAQSGSLTIREVDESGLTSELNFKDSKKVIDNIRTQMKSDKPDIQLHYKPDRETLGGATRVTVGGKSYDILGIHDPNEQDLVDANWLQTQNDVDIAIGTNRILTLGYLGNKPITFNVDDFKNGNISIRQYINDDDPYIASKFGILNMSESDNAYYEQVIYAKHLEKMIMSFRGLIAQNRNQDGSLNIDKKYINTKIAPVILNYLQSLELLTNINKADKEQLIEGVEYQLGISLKELGLEE